jgi:hypothetical protein
VFLIAGAGALLVALVLSVLSSIDRRADRRGYLHLRE